MASMHPERARNSGNTRVSDERGFSVKRRAEYPLSVQEKNRKRKWNTSGDEHEMIEGGEVMAPNRHGSARSKVHGPGKNARLDAPHPKTLDPDRSKRSRREASDPPRQNNPRKRNKQKLEKAHRLAPNYPDLRDIEAWRKLGQNGKRKPHTEHTFVYRHLRLDQCPKALAYTEWSKRVQQEMVALGLQDAYTGPSVDKMLEGEVKDMDKEEVAQEAMRKVEDEQVRREMDRMIADDGLDIDIYGDEETRRKYEPWIRSRMGRT